MNVFWDYDGTLMDTYPVMARCLEDLMAARGQRMAPGGAMALLKVSLSHALAEASARTGEAEESLLRDFRTRETALAGEVRPAEGMDSLMRRLAEVGARQFLVTHRDRAALSGLARFGLDRYLTGWVTAENGFPRKPDPSGLLYLMRRWDAAPETSVMVGDRPLDVRAGLMAGMAGILLDTDNRFPGEKCTCTVHCAAQLEECLLARLAAGAEGAMSE